MAKSRPILTLTLIWLAWAVILSGFQALVTRRLLPQPADYALSWTANETGRNGQQYKPYLLEKYLNEHVSWDSEFYLSIATKGYDDPDLRALLRDGPAHEAFIPATGLPYGSQTGGPPAGAAPDPGRYVSLNYAFFPLYPYAMRAAGFVLRPFGLTPIATATLAGVLISLLGALAAMVALYDLTRERLGEDGGLRSAFYLLIFPTGFFLAQVYTEGLFVGLAFGCLALLRRKRLLLAAILAALATWTRAVGVALVIPLALAAWEAWRNPREAGTSGGAIPQSDYERLTAALSTSAATVAVVNAGQPVSTGLGHQASNPLDAGRAAAVVNAGQPVSTGLGYQASNSFDAGRAASAAPAGEATPRVMRSAPAGRAPRSRIGAATSAVASSPVAAGFLAALPLVAFAAWRFSPLGANFQFVEDRFFGRGPLLTGPSFASFGEGLAALSGKNPQAAAYYAIEFAIIVIALAACLFTLRRYPGLALFGLAVLAISLGSGAVQSAGRYVLAVPSIFVALAQLGRSRAFDRGWTLAGVLLMGLLAALFSLDMWVA